MERERPCCGGGSREPGTRAPSSPARPNNAGKGRAANGAVKVIYVGGRNVRFQGASGVWYHFGPMRRRGVVGKDDLAAALAHADFMLEPDARK